MLTVTWAINSTNASPPLRKRTRHQVCVLFKKTLCMRKRFVMKKAKLNRKAKNAGYHGTTPFTEKPSIDHSPGHADKNAAGEQGRLAASDLFSMFTADIIRKDVPFTRWGLTNDQIRARSFPRLRCLSNFQLMSCRLVLRALFFCPGHTSLIR